MREKNTGYVLRTTGYTELNKLPERYIRNRKHIERTRYMKLQLHELCKLNK